MAGAAWVEPRSILFVPADAGRFIAKAASRGADVIVLDLEDGVAPSSKATARASLPRSISLLRAQGATVYVRVNNEPSLLQQDLHAAASAQADGIVLPKVESQEQLQDLDRELAAHSENSAMGIIGLVESPLGICRVLEIAKSTVRLRALCFGSEDFAAAMGIEPSTESLGWPAHAMAVAAVAAGVQPLGLLGSVGNFADLAGYRDLVARSRQIGMRGATCIHPAQVAILNEEFTASDADVAAAHRLVTLFDAAVREGKGAIAVDGKMVDAPIAQRARLVLLRHRARQPAAFMTHGSDQT